MIGQSGFLTVLCQIFSEMYAICLQEMSGLSYFMLDQSRKDADNSMETAFNSYMVLLLLFVIVLLCQHWSLILYKYAFCMLISVAA